MTDKPSGPRAVARAGQLLYGDEWQSPLQRELGMNLRTLQRSAKAAAEGADYPVAPGVLKDLAAILGSRAASCASMAADLGGDVARPAMAEEPFGIRANVAQFHSSAPAPPPAEPSACPLIELTPAALEAGRAVLEEMDAPRPTKAARAAFLAMAEALGLQVVALG